VLYGKILDNAVNKRGFNLRFSIELLEKTENKDEVVYRISLGHIQLKALVFNKDHHSHSDNVKVKIKFIEDFFIVYPDIQGIKALRSFAKIDNDMKEYYKTQFPHGGYRKGGGRPTGTKKENRSVCFYKAITAKEKKYLEKCLNDFRIANIK